VIAFVLPSDVIAVIAVARTSCLLLDGKRIRPPVPRSMPAVSRVVLVRLRD